MGLALVVYEDFKKTDKEDFEGFKAYTLDGFEDRIKNLEFGQNYEAKCVSRLPNVPYSYHNKFRKALAKLAGTDCKTVWANPDKYANIPFFELIEFADNEGCMDWEVTANLAKDFKDLHHKAKEVFSKEMMDHYEDWGLILEFAEDNRVLVFC